MEAVEMDVEIELKEMVTEIEPEELEAVMTGSQLLVGLSL